MEWQDTIEHAPDAIKKGFIRRRHEKGSSIVFPDERNDYLYLLTAGQADVILLSAAGKAVTMYAYTAYSCFGELELFKKDAKTFDVICRTACETISVHQDIVFQWMKADFSFTRLILAQLADKLSKASHTLARLSLLSVKERLMHCVYMHSLAGDLPLLSKANACAETCIPMRSLNRALKECKDEGLIGFTKKRFCILSPSKLEAYCRELVS